MPKITFMSDDCPVALRWFVGATAMVELFPFQWRFGRSAGGVNIGPLCISRYR